MSVNLADIRSKILYLQDAIEAATSAASYGKGDRQVSRQAIADLERSLSRARREERELVALANGATSPGTLSASWG